ncbi:hypothetical protein AB0H76_05115 [Nocardia sp. NPDC050712]|uniref:hypothetical protein n=1 Tax=Nocardia sp. NPDC050712 TaxID=3155518 RepID=UPI0034009F68
MTPPAQRPFDESRSLCRRCGRAVERPDPSVSCHRTSEGTVRYTRCPCGLAQIWLRPFGAGDLLRH